MVRSVGCMVENNEASFGSAIPYSGPIATDGIDIHTIELEYASSQFSFSKPYTLDFWDCGT